MKGIFRVDWKNKWHIYYTFCFFLTVGFGYFYFDWLFAIKPFVVLTIMGMAISLFFLKSMKPLFGFEKYLMLFFLIYMIACIRLYNLNYGIRYLCGILLIITFYFCARMAMERVSIVQLEKIISYSGIIICIASLVAYIWGIYLVDFQFSDIIRFRAGGVLIENSIPRLNGVLDADPNIAALMMLLYLFYYLSHLDGGRNYLGALLSSVFILLTFSRSALLALVAAAVIGKVIPYYVRKPVRFRKTDMLMLLFIILFFIFLKVYGFDWWAQIKQRFLLLSFDKGAGRFTLWKYGIQGWLESPIFGVGGNYTKTCIEQYMGTGKLLHNTWLEIAMETGIVGMIPCVCFLWKLYQCVMEVESKESRYLVVLLTSMLVMMCSLSVQFNPSFYLLIALIYRYMLEKEETEDGRCHIH